MIYSIVETAKENGLDPLVYLCFLFDTLPNSNLKNAAELDALMPWSSDAQRCCRTSDQAK